MLREAAVITVISLGISLLNAGDPNRVPNIIPKNLREYYPQLSDAEFASLEPKPAYFPLVVHRFFEAPLMLADVLPVGAKYGTDIGVKAQQYLLDNTKDPKLLANTISELAVSRNPNAVPMITAALPSLTDANLIVDCLRALHTLKAEVRGKDLQPYLKSASQDVRLAVLRLYCTQKYALSQKVLTSTENEADIRIRIRGIQAAAACRDKGTFDLWLKYLEGADGEAFAAALPALVSFPEINTKKAVLLRWCKAEEPIGPMSLAIHCGEKLEQAISIELLKALSENQHRSVRSETAVAIARLGLNELQDVLLKLSTDEATDVRQQATIALASHKDARTFNALMNRSGDIRSLKTRKHAREAVIAMASAVRVPELIRPYLDSQNELIRESAYHILFRLQDKSYGNELSAKLPGEKRPLNIAECLKALGAAKGIEAEMLVLRYADDKSPIVRCAVAETIGAINSRKGYRVLERYVKQEDVERKDVRRAALLAMARINDPTFAKTYLYVLKRVDPETKSKIQPLSGDDRTVACWAAARLAQPDADLGQRLYDQVMKTVLPMEGSPPEYDVTEVRVSATLALCMWSLRTNDERSAQRAGFCMSGLKITEGTGSNLPSSATLRSFGKQITHYYKGEDFSRETTDPRPTHFSLEYIDKK